MGGFMCARSCQQALTVPQKAAGSAALLGGDFCIALQQLGSPPLGFPQVQQEAWEAPDPAVLVEGSGRAEALGLPSQTQKQQHLCHCHQQSHGPVAGPQGAPLCSWGAPALQRPSLEG